MEQNFECLKDCLACLGIHDLTDVTWNEALRAWELRGKYGRWSIISTAPDSKCNSTDDVKLMLFKGFVQEMGRIERKLKREESEAFWNTVKQAFPAEPYMRPGQYPVDWSENL